MNLTDIWGFVTTKKQTKKKCAAQKKKKNKFDFVPYPPKQLDTHRYDKTMKS